MLRMPRRMLYGRALPLTRLLLRNATRTSPRFIWSNKPTVFAKRGFFLRLGRRSLGQFFIARPIPRALEVTWVGWPFLRQTPRTAFGPEPAVPLPLFLCVYLCYVSVLVVAPLREISSKSMAPLIRVSFPQTHALYAKNPRRMRLTFCALAHPSLPLGAWLHVALRTP
jgi:hypothetical protein